MTQAPKLIVKLEIQPNGQGKDAATIKEYLIVRPENQWQTNGLVLNYDTEKALKPIWD